MSRNHNFSVGYYLYNKTSGVQSSDGLHPMAKFTHQGNAYEYMLFMASKTISPNPNLYRQYAVLKGKKLLHAKNQSEVIHSN